MARRQYRRQYNGTTRVQQGIQAGYSLPAKQHWHESQCAPCKGCQRRKRPNKINFLSGCLLQGIAAAGGFWVWKQISSGWAKNLALQVDYRREPEIRQHSARPCCSNGKPARPAETSHAASGLMRQALRTTFIEGAYPCQQ